MDSPFVHPHPPIGLALPPSPIGFPITGSSPAQWPFSHSRPAAAADFALTHTRWSCDRPPAKRPHPGALPRPRCAIELRNQVVCFSCSLSKNCRCRQLSHHARLAQVRALGKPRPEAFTGRAGSAPTARSAYQLIFRRRRRCIPLNDCGALPRRRPIVGAGAWHLGIARRCGNSRFRIPLPTLRTLVDCSFRISCLKTSVR